MGNYRTQHHELEAFCFYYEVMPDWFINKITSNDVILINCNYSKHNSDEAMCIINAKSNKKTLVQAGEYIYNTNYNELGKIHPDIFNTKYEKNI